MASRRLAILGAGPIGIEAALAAVEHRWPFTLYEAGDEVADSVRDWGHVRLFSPWSLDVSPRMARALGELGREVPAGDRCPTGEELRSEVLVPLAHAPAIEEHLRLRSEVVAIGRQGLLKHEAIGTGERGEVPFRLLVRTPRGEAIEHADVVLDCTGSYAEPNRLGDGGIPAPGEPGAEERITRRIPDFDRRPEAWAGRRLLLVGAGHSAQTAAEALARLADSGVDVAVTWALRNPSPRWEIDPDDPLPERARLTAAARDLAAGGHPAFEVLTGVVVERLDPVDGELLVTLRAADGSLRSIAVDRVLALTGSVGDHTLYRQLQVHECYATSGPMKLAAALLGASSGDCLAQESHGVDTLTSPEPDFFILGAKSYGRNTSFLMRVGWQQVDEVFGLLGDGDGG